jgi:hypothetical protein
LENKATRERRVKKMPFFMSKSLGEKIDLACPMMDKHLQKLFKLRFVTFAANFSTMKITFRWIR